MVGHGDGGARAAGPLLRAALAGPRARQRRTAPRARHGRVHRHGAERRPSGDGDRASRRMGAQRGGHVADQQRQAAQRRRRVQPQRGRPAVLAGRAEAVGRSRPHRRRRGPRAARDRARARHHGARHDRTDRAHHRTRPRRSRRRLRHRHARRDGHGGRSAARVPRGGRRGRGDGADRHGHGALAVTHEAVDDESQTTRPARGGVPLTRRPAFWLWAAVCLIGGWIAITGLDAAVRAFPAGAVAGAALLTPTLMIGVWALRRLHPVRTRPIGYSLVAVAWGAFAAFGLALPANAAFQAVLSKTAGPGFNSEWGAAIAAPVNEETLKLLGVLTLALMAPTSIRGPLDGWGYGALTGLGFQIAENFLYVLNTIVLTGATQDLHAAFFSFGGRVIGGAWWSHWAMTAVAGAGLGCLLGRATRTTAVLAAGAFVLAMALHAWWDAPILVGLGMLVLKGLPILLAAVVTYRLARRRYLTHFRRTAYAETVRGVFVPGEGHVLAHRKWRRKERWDVPAGEPRRLLARLRATELELIEDGLGGLEHDPRTADLLRDDVRDLRRHLNSCPSPPRVA
ncbi:PrsW family intramembrane metalloprotease [Actinomadura decatromicini]|uniref:PrsW family intramembrane metalloprotease n=1 Tax=Actinomadura decatromicini TaxID=2604572 RepID=A0A5D3FIJ2_9ACTN|nr:PrsW family intramembrane metalloprotease [Actinomadura decatromicini]